MPDWLENTARQVPELVVLVLLVGLFMRALGEISKDGRTALSELARDGKAALNDAHATTGKVVDQFTAERTDTIQRLERIAENAHHTARETHLKFAEAIDEMKTVVIELKSIIQAR